MALHFPNNRAPVLWSDPLSCPFLPALPRAPKPQEERKKREAEEAETARLAAIKRESEEKAAKEAEFLADDPYAAKVKAERAARKGGLRVCVCVESYK